MRSNATTLMGTCLRRAGRDNELRDGPVRQRQSPLGLVALPRGGHDMASWTTPAAISRAKAVRIVWGYAHGKPQVMAVAKVDVASMVRSRGS